MAKYIVYKTEETCFQGFKLLIGEYFFKKLLFENFPQNQIKFVLFELQNVKFDKSCLKLRVSPYQC